MQKLKPKPMTNKLRVCLVKKFPKHIREKLYRQKMTTSVDDVKLSNSKVCVRVIGVYNHYWSRKAGIYHHQIYVQSTLPRSKRYSTLLHEFVHYLLNRIFPRSWQNRIQLWWELIWHWQSRSTCRWYRQAHKAAFSKKEKSNG